MGNASQSETTYQKISEWLPLALIAGGLAIQWVGSEYGGLIFIAGLLLYGIFGLQNSVKRKFYRGGFLRFIKIAVDVTIILLALGFLIGIGSFWYLLMLILLDRLVLIPKTTE